MKSAAEILREAIGYVEHGWRRGDLEDQFHRVCAVGAINRATVGSAMLGEFQTPGRAKAMRLLAQVMREQYDLDELNLVYYQPGYCALKSGDENVITDTNDDRVHSRQEIIACMEKAAILAER
jgi:hypothetical protein